MTGEKRKSALSASRLRMLVLFLVVLAAIGLYLLKNPPGVRDGAASDPTAAGLYQSEAFDLEATGRFDLEAILSHNLPVVVDFGADTCIPCKEMAPILAELNQELRGKAVIKFVDVAKDSTGAQSLPIEVIPTQFFFNADGSPYKPADERAAAARGFVMYSLKSTGEHVYTAHQGGLGKDELLAILREMGMK